MGLDSPTTDDLVVPPDSDASSPSALTKLKRDAFITSIAGLSMYGSAMLTSPLTARALHPQGRGDLTAVVLPTQVLAWILTFGLPTASMYFAQRFSRRALVMGAWVTALIVGGTFTLATWWLVPSYLGSHNPITVGWFRAFLILSAIWVVAYVAIDLKLSHGSVIAYNVLRILPFGLNAIGIVVLSISGHLTLNTALASQFGAYVAWMVIVFTYTRSWPGRGFQRVAFRGQLHYGARVVVGTISDFMVSRLDQLLLVSIVSSDELGIYAVAAVIAGVSQPVAYAFSSVVFPRLVATRESGGDHKSASEALRYTIYASLLCTVGIAIATPWVLPWVFGESFRGAVWPLILLLPGQMCQNIATVIGTRLQALGHPHIASQAAVIAAVVTAVGLFLFIEPFGIEGAAVVTTVSQLVTMVYVMARERRLRGVAPASTLIAAA